MRLRPLPFSDALACSSNHGTTSATRPIDAELTPISGSWSSICTINGRIVRIGMLSIRLAATAARASLPGATNPCTARAVSFSPPAPIYTTGVISLLSCSCAANTPLVPSLALPSPPMITATAPLLSFSASLWRVVRLSWSVKQTSTLPPCSCSHSTTGSPYRLYDELWLFTLTTSFLSCLRSFISRC